MTRYDENFGPDRSRMEAIDMLNASDRGAGRLQTASTKPEGRWLLATAAVLTAAVATLNLIEGSWTDSGAGITAMVLIIALAALVAWRRAASRTVRPKYFSLVWSISAVWVGLGIGVSTSSSGFLVSPTIAMSVTAGLIVAAPFYGCGIWLLVRSR